MYVIKDNCDMYIGFCISSVCNGVPTYNYSCSDDLDCASQFDTVISAIKYMVDSGVLVGEFIVVNAHNGNVFCKLEL